MPAKKERSEPPEILYMLNLQIVLRSFMENVNMYNRMVKTYKKLRISFTFYTLRNVKFLKNLLINSKIYYIIDLLKCMLRVYYYILLEEN